MISIVLLAAVAVSVPDPRAALVDLQLQGRPEAALSRAAEAEAADQDLCRAFAELQTEARKVALGGGVGGVHHEDAFHP